jgi:hypothetical protein
MLSWEVLKGAGFLRCETALSWDTGKENPVCQSIRRPCDIGRSLRTVLCKTSVTHLHSNIATDLNSLSRVAVLTLRFTDFPSVCAQPVPSL